MTKKILFRLNQLFEVVESSYSIALTSRNIRHRNNRLFGDDRILGYLAGVPKLVYGENPLVKLAIFTQFYQRISPKISAYTNFGTPARYPKIELSPNRRLFLSRMSLEVTRMQYEVRTSSKSQFNRKRIFFSSQNTRSQWESPECLGIHSLNITMLYNTVKKANLKGR